MDTSSRVKALLELTGKNQTDLAAAFGMTTPQAMNNKMRRDSWSAKDLAKAAAICGAKLLPFVVQSWRSSCRMAPSSFSHRTKIDRYTTKPAPERTSLPEAGFLFASFLPALAAKVRIQARKSEVLCGFSGQNIQNILKLLS